jgi:glucan phosphorylase
MDPYVPLPPLPARIERLNDLAHDLWWSWNAEAREVFRDLDYPLWRFTDHNPVLLLHLVEPERLAHAAEDPEFLRLYDSAIASLDVVRAGAGTWWSRQGQPAAAPIACIAPGFSLHQALPLDSDARAVAVGDYCKEASDLGVPVVGVGLMYPRGYVHQRLSGDGWQQESHEYLDWSDVPVSPAPAPGGGRCAFALDMPWGTVHVQVWQVRVGRVTLYLLDTDVAANAPADREINAAFVPPGSEAAERRRAVLAEGAARALPILGIETSAIIDPQDGLRPGVHVPGWIARELAVLIERDVGPDWRDHQDEASWWEGLSAVPDEALWTARQRLRGYLIDFARERARRRWTREQASGPRLVAQGTLLDPATLTIGFAQRMTPDLRVDGLFHDPERLAAILTARRRPVQIIFAGRAHPGDEAAKRYLQRIFARALDPMFGGRIAFLEDYDLHAARLLVQGCDLWLTAGSADAGSPPLGALKAAINGVPPLALDPSMHEPAAARALYRRLEEDIVPVFYHRDRRGVPAEWVGRVRDTLRTGIPAFSARRAVKASTEKLYNPGLRHV